MSRTACVTVVMSQFGALPVYYIVCSVQQCGSAATRGDMTAEPMLVALFGPAPVFGLQ